MLRLGRFVDVVDVIDYVNTLIYVTCVDASDDVMKMAAPGPSMDSASPREQEASKTPRSRSSKVWE